MTEAVYAIEEFPDNDLLWRIEWLGGVSYNASAPSGLLLTLALAPPLRGWHAPKLPGHARDGSNVIFRQACVKEDEGSW
jgi:hypothetical protein